MAVVIYVILRTEGGRSSRTRALTLTHMAHSGNAAFLKVGFRLQSLAEYAGIFV